MKRFRLAFIALWATTGLAHADTPAQPDAEAPRGQIQQVVETFCAAIIAKDTARLSELFMPVGHSWTLVLGDDLYRQAKAKRPDSPKIMPTSYEEFVKVISSSPQRLEERFANLSIRTDGAVASLYFDYIFLMDGKESNRGHETWQLVDTGAGWKISALSYSVNSATLK